MQSGFAAAIVSLAALAVAITPPAAETAVSPLGLWEHPENGSRIELYPCGGENLCVRIQRVADGQDRDTKNPDPSLRERAIIGLVIVAGARRTGPGTWSGTIYNRIDGQHYDGRLSVTPAGKLQLTGCTAVIVCRTVLWNRVTAGRKGR